MQVRFKKQHYKQTFRGVGAHYQSSVADHAIQPHLLRAFTMLLYASLHYIALALFPFAISHAVCLELHTQRSYKIISSIPIFVH